MWKLRKRAKQDKWQNEDKAFAQRGGFLNAERSRSPPPPHLCAFVSSINTAAAALLVIPFPVCPGRLFRLEGAIL